MSFDTIRQEYNKNAIKICTRNNEEYQIGWTSKGTLVLRNSLAGDPVHKLLKDAEKVNTRIFNFLYGKEDVKNALDFLELFIGYESSKHEYIGDTPEDPSVGKSKGTIKEIKRNLKAISSLETLYELIDLPESDHKKLMALKLKTTVKQVEKIFSDISIKDKLAFGDSVMRAIEVLKGYRKKIL